MEILCFGFMLTLLFLQSVQAEGGRQSWGSAVVPQGILAVHVDV